MSLKLQLTRLKENWLLLLILILILLTFNYLPTFKEASFLKSASYDQAVGGFAERSMMPISSENFAPEATERVLTKTAYLSTEIKRGQYQETDSKVKNLIEANKAILLNENINKNEISNKIYITSYYQIKVPTTNYDSFVAEIKSIKELKSFTETTEDITQQKLDLTTNLQAEKTRLMNYQKILNEATLAADKLEVTDRIFNQERTIKFYEEMLANLNNRVSYSTISLTISEK